jgi:NAD(P)-dependent dehydrogenase (short-subunit alcohol dehydrogenase family)
MWTTRNIPDQRGKTIIITGANTGIGYETALAFYQAGADVILACRDNVKAEEAIAKLQLVGGRGALKAITLDLSDLNLVKKFAEKIRQDYTSLHVLINNAGIATPPASKTSLGYELQFGVNFLGHFALTGHLYSLLNSAPGSRVVTLSSNGYQSAAIDFDNLKSEKDYDRMREYRQSKLANLIFAIELDRRIKAKGDSILSIAAQPGANKTELTRHLTEEEVNAGIARLGEFMEPWQGALPSLYAAISNDVEGGKMYEPDNGGYRGYPTLASIQENAMDKKVAGRLWDLAEEVTGVVYPL